jgi:hypothetical protein
LSHFCRKYRRLCRFCRLGRLLSAVPSIICGLTHSMAWKRLEEPANETFTRPHERLSRARCRDQFLPRSGLQDRAWSKVWSSCARPLKEGPWLESCLSSQFETIPSGLRHLFKNPKIKPLSGILCGEIQALTAYQRERRFSFLQASRLHRRQRTNRLSPLCSITEFSALIK